MVNEEDRMHMAVSRGRSGIAFAPEFDLAEPLQEVALQEMSECNETYEDPKGMDEGIEKNDAGERYFFSGWVDCASRRGFFR